MDKKLKDYIKETIDNRGKNPSKYFSKEKYPVIDNVLIKNTLYPNMNEATRYINQYTFDNFLRGYVHKNMPLITLVGNGIGNVTLAPSDDVVIVQNTIGFEVTDELDEIFLFYYLKVNQQRIRSFNRGSGQPSVRKTDILSLPVKFPDLSIQQKIGSFLKSLDDKIETNNKINRNLEEQAKALFQKIFIENSDNIKGKTGTFSELIVSTRNGDWGKASSVGNYIEKVYCIRVKLSIMVGIFVALLQVLCKLQNAKRKMNFIYGCVTP